MQLPGGLSERGWLKAATRSRWPFVEIPAKGGKGGVKKVFSPPPELLRLIHRHARGEPVAASEVDSAKGRQEARLVPQHQEWSAAQAPVEEPDGGEDARHGDCGEWAGGVDLKDYRPLRYYRDISLSAGHGALNYEGEPPGALLFSEAWLRTMGLKPERLLLVRVSGDSMLPTLQPGSTVMIDTTATRVTSGIYAINLGGAAMVKRLQALLGGVIRVISDNPAYDAFQIKRHAAETDGFSIIGRVVWHAGAVP